MSTARENRRRTARRRKRLELWRARRTAPQKPGAEEMYGLAVSGKTISLFKWQLDSMPNYSATLPSATTSFKMWRRDVNEPRRHQGEHDASPEWWVGQYYPIDLPGKTGIHWFDTRLLQGPMPLDWEPPDWHNSDAYKGPYMFPKHIAADGTAHY